MENNLLLSVIIPIYKVEKYLRRCIDSVINQKVSNCEIILVDDGSPDGCPMICDEYANKYDNIIVIHKENGGLSSARNEGMKRAKGKYVMFLDSDDQWIPGKLQALLNQMKKSNVEMLVFDAIALYPDGSIRKRDNKDFFKESFRVLDKQSYYKEVTSIGDFLQAAYTKILLRSFLIENELFFFKGILAEDSEWMFRLLRCAKKVAISNIYFYIFTSRREGSIQNSISSKSIKDLVLIIDKSIMYYQNNTNEETRQLELEQCSYLLANATGLLYYIKGNEKNELKKLLRPYAYLYDYSKRSKTKMAKVVYRLLGFNVLVFTLELYMVLMKMNLLNRKNKFNE